MERVINRVVRFQQLFDLAGMKIRTKKFKCPFHDGTSNNSAVILKDERGERLYCYSEEKTYKPTDFIQKGFITVGIETLYNTIWPQLPDEFKQRIMEETDEYKKSKILLPKNIEDSAPVLADFKKGKYDYKQFQKYIVALCQGATLIRTPR